MYSYLHLEDNGPQTPVHTTEEHKDREALATLARREVTTQPHSPTRTATTSISGRKVKPVRAPPMTVSHTPRVEIDLTQSDDDDDVPHPFANSFRPYSGKREEGVEKIEDEEFEEGLWEQLVNLKNEEGLGPPTASTSVSNSRASSYVGGSESVTSEEFASQPAPAAHNVDTDFELALRMQAELDAGRDLDLDMFNGSGSSTYGIPNNPVSNAGVFPNGPRSSGSGGGVFGRVDEETQTLYMSQLREMLRENPNEIRYIELVWQCEFMLHANSVDQLEKIKFQKC